jgi:hypothetical protein
MISVLNACSSYTVTEPKIPEPAAMPHTQTEGTISISVDPYVQADRQKAIFGGDMFAVGVLPLQVVVENAGERSVRIDSNNFRLALPGEEVVGPRPGTEVATLFASHSSAADYGSAGLGVLGQVFGAIGGLIGNVLGSVFSGTVKGSESDALRARQEDYSRKELKSVMLGKNESTRGFLYFGLPAGTPAFDEATLVLEIPDSQMDITSVRVVLKDLGYKGISGTGR